MKLRLPYFFALGCAVFAAACGGADDSVGVDRQDIARGTDDPGSLQVMALVVTRWDGRTVYCSSVLYAPRTLATAAHCLDRAQRVLAYFGDDFLGDFRQLEFPDPPNWRTATDFRRHPRYSRRTLDADIAVVHLDREVPVKPMRLHEPRIDHAFVGAAVQIVGYGAALVDPETGTQPKDHFVKRSGFASYVGTPRQGHSLRDGHRRTRGDHPSIRDYRRRWQLMELDGAAPNAAACLGDAGGPALLKIDGEVGIVGINTWHSSFCDGYSYYVRVSEHVRFLRAHALTR